MYKAKVHEKTFHIFFFCVCDFIQRFNAHKSHIILRVYVACVLCEKLWDYGFIKKKKTFKNDSKHYKCL